MSRRRGISISMDASGDATPLQEEARTKVKQAIIISYGNPEDPKRIEMEMMLQFLQTLQDLEMFTTRYSDDLSDLAKIQVDMQLKTLDTWRKV